MEDSQNKVIQEGKVDFIIMRVKEERDSNLIVVPYLYRNYKIVKEVSQRFEEIDFKYILFQKRSSL